MRQSLGAAFFLAFAFPLIADEKDDAKKLNGTYEVISIVSGGKPDNESKGEILHVAIKDGMIKTKSIEEVDKFTVDAGKKPAHFDILPNRDRKKLFRGFMN